MLKGNVAVILYDKDGNEVDRREAHNLVTNATAELLNHVAGASGGFSKPTELTGSQAMDNILPLGENALGGLLLFEDALDTNAANYYIPGDNVIIASADRAANNDNPNRGSLNTDGSGKIQTGFKSTWDFSTSQANGTISAIALTSVLCGGNPATFSNISLKRPTKFSDGTNEYSGTNLLPLKYDKTTQYYYFAYPNGTVVVSGQTKAKYAIYKIKIPFYSFGVADSATQVGLVETTEHNDIVTNYQSHNYTNYCVDAENGYAYIQNNLSTSGTSAGDLTYTKVNLSTFAYEQGTKSFGAVIGGWCVSGGNFYYTKAGKVGRVPVGSGTATEVNVEGVTAGYKPIVSPGGLVYIMNSSSSTGYVNSYVAFQDARLTVKRFGQAKNQTVNVSPLYFGMICAEPKGSSFATEFRAIHDYLGTKFNLQTPVNKTDATTMKVVYTLTDVTQ